MDKRINLVIVGGIRTHYIKIYTFQKMLSIIDKEIVSKFNFIYIDAGQHYDNVLCDDFITEQNIQFDYRIYHQSREGEYIWGNMLKELGLLYDRINSDMKIDYVIVFGDVITTAIASLVAMFKHYKIIHIEAGVRITQSDNVEEKCRKIADYLSEIRFTSNKCDLKHLDSEGLGHNSFFSGDVIYDYIKKIGVDSSRRIITYKFNSQKYEFDLNQEYVLISIHHTENQDINVLKNIFTIYEKASYKALFIVHPIIKRMIEENEIKSENVILADHIDYESNLIVIQNAKYILTDSGGIQREAFYLNKRCIVCSSFTVWESIINLGSSRMVNSTLEDISEGIMWAENSVKIDYKYNDLFGDGNAVYTILKSIWEVDNCETFNS